MSKQKTNLSASVTPGKKTGYKLEIGISGFKERMHNNCIYVDKTQYIYELINRDSHCFLSRPRRFGKSLLISTFKEIFSGSKELFKDCWIYDKIEWEEYPVIHLDFLSVHYRDFGVEQALSDKLDAIAAEFNMTLKGKASSAKFEELILSLAGHKQAVVLIDEYDKPIIDYMEDIPQAEKNRKTLKGFYSVLKAKADKIRFLFITGVSKFSRMSIFSDLNHLKDITINPRYSRMLGYTQEEIETNFSEYISQWETETCQNRQVLFEKLKDYYNGYSWDGKYFVYNPFSILSFFDNYLFENYWFATGTPTFLINILKKTGVPIAKYDRLNVLETFFQKYDLDDMNSDTISSLLFQTGYLTIKEKKDNTFVLSYPNREVKMSFLHFLLEGFSHKPQDEAIDIALKIKTSLEENKIEDFIRNITNLLSSIPYNIQIQNREAYYHSIIYVALQLSLLEVQAEVQTAYGRSDIIVCTDRYIYIIEFKMASAQTALDQIAEKRYYEPYLGKNKPIFLLGIGFDESKRNIGDWLVKEAPGALPAVSEMEAARIAEKRQMAKRMLEKKYPFEDIVLLSGLSLEEVQALQTK